MNHPSKCPRCGAALPANPADAICAACLLSFGAPDEAVTVRLGTPTPSSFNLDPGGRLGSYLIGKELGRGGMGVVFDATQAETGRRVALKVLSQPFASSEARIRFLREGRLAATINHPNSVYVFGTEEIEGTPVIVMELAAGGTLRDELKRRGTMPVRDAVDAILGIIDGLESAHAKGILHRDMKPTNCFVTGEGKAVVGDYGLSISQAPDADCLTQSGLIMGTPAFSPPEQLRGLPLDVRADIYSTAGTLYYLLTGRAPVERASSVETVAAVLEGRILGVRTHRQDVPEDLAAVIAKCLSPEAANRPGTYDEMRALLLPFSSTAADPAPLGLRLLAGLFDGLASAMLFYALVFAHPARWNAAPHWLATFWNLLIVLPVLALMTTRFSATPGQWLCRLRVQTQNGARPGWLPSLQWNAWFVLGAVMCAWLVFFLGETAAFNDTPPSLAWGLLLLIAGQLHLLYFVPALRREDRAAWHDLRSAVRLTRRRDSPKRLRAIDVLPQVRADDAAMWGPFAKGEAITDDLRCGLDPVLRRRVLLRRAGSTPLTDARRDCARAGRLRWLQRVTATDGSQWDACQALAGAPLSIVLREQAPTWSEMLFWLQDISAELDAASKDDTLHSSLSLHQVWITDDGRAVLLDEPWPGLQAASTTDDPQRFLHLMAAQVSSVERPLHADELMRGLEASAFERLSHLSGNLAHLRQKRSTVSASVRAACVLGPMLAAALMFAAVCWMADALYRSGWEIAQPGLPPLPDVLKLDPEPGQPHPTDAAVRKQMRVHLAGHYHDYKANKLLVQTMDEHTTQKQRDKLLQIIDEEIIPSPAALEVADQAVRTAIERLPIRGPLGEANMTKAAAVLSLGAIFIVACTQLLGILIGSPPLLMRLTGMALVTSSHRPASRLQLFRRWLIGWSALWSVAIVMLIAVGTRGYDPIRKLPENGMIWVPVMLVLMIAGLSWCRRSLLDRLAGTWIVAQ